MAGRSSRTLWAQKIAGNLSSPKDAPVTLSKPYTGTILGIDPSLRGTGLALISLTKSREIVLHKSETIRLKTAFSFSQCLGAINQAVAEMLSLKHVDHVAIEQTIYVQNFQTAQILGAARGAAIAAAAVRSLDIHEYPPLRVKQAVVGYGRASKDQVAKTLMNYLGHTEPLPSDEADAAAVALCHAFTWKG